MPQFRVGNMFDLAEGYIFVTTNASLRKDGSLVMGRGAALEATKRYPGIDVALGKLVAERRKHVNDLMFGKKGLYFYGLIYDPNLPIGAFQVKYRWHDDASMHLIGVACERLTMIGNGFKDQVFNVNYPGIGNGNIYKSTVEGMINLLPSNIVVWELR